MDQQRKGETSNTLQRSNRYYFINGVWYFQSRKGEKHGPYTSKKEMEAALQRYIESQ